MKEAVSNLNNTMMTLSIYLIIAAIIGYIIVPVFLKKIGVDKKYRVFASKISMVFLLFIAFTGALQSLSS